MRQHDFTLLDLLSLNLKAIREFPEVSLLRARKLSLMQDVLRSDLGGLAYRASGAQVPQVEVCLRFIYVCLFIICVCREPSIECAQSIGIG